MSIYSGFGTRQQETHYNRTVEKILFLLSDNIIYTYLGESFNEERWFKKIRQLFMILVQMEPYKYLKPKFSEGVKDLVAAFSNKYISVENSMAGTDLDLRTEKSFALAKKQQKLENFENGYLAVPSVSTSKRPPRPQINFPHSAGRNKSTSPAFAGAPTTEYYPTAKSSSYKRKEVMGQNASVIQNLESRLNQSDGNQSLIMSRPGNEQHVRNNSRHSQPELQISDIAARPADLSTLQTNMEYRKSSGNRLKAAKMESNKNSMTNSRRMLAHSGMQDTQIRVSQRKLKSAGRRTGPYKVANYPPTFSRESSGTTENQNYRLDSTSQGRGNSNQFRIGPMSGKNSQMHTYFPEKRDAQLRNRNDLQDASLEQISNFLIQKHEQQHAINFFHKRPESREGKRTPQNMKRPQSGVVNNNSNQLRAEIREMHKNSTVLEQLQKKQNTRDSVVPVLDM